jgi:hypothetical protein
MGVRAVIALALGLAVAGTACTSSPPAPPDRTITSVQTLTRPPSTAPVVAGPTTSAEGSCPFLDQQTAAGDVGMRLARTTVESSGGKPVGCNFYALQGSPLSESEHLPGPNQPAIRITSTRYPDAAAAHNAMVRAAGQQAQQAKVGTLTGLAFQVEFDPADKGKDWACAFTKGDTLVVVTTAVTTPSFNAVALANDIVDRF